MDLVDIQDFVFIQQRYSQKWHPLLGDAVGKIWVLWDILPLFDSIEERGGYWNAVIFIIIDIAHLAGDDMVLDAIRNMFTSEAAQVKWLLCFVPWVQSAYL